jgi:DNA-binding transcriptional ArsR family regulator
MLPQIVSGSRRSVPPSKREATLQGPADRATLTSLTPGDPRNAGPRGQPDLTGAPAETAVLTCDHLVTYDLSVVDDDLVFKALADPTRRFLLDLLFEREARSLTELEAEVDMTRFGVMKHLRLLEEAGLVVTRRSGREKLHFLNPVPIRLVHDRWIDKYTERQVSALADLKTELEARK